MVDVDVPPREGLMDELVNAWPGESWDDRMPGLVALVRMLRFPDFVFGEPSARRARTSSEPTDWDVIKADLRRYLEHWDAPCGDVILHLWVAADVLRRHGVRICQGVPAIDFFWEDDSMEISIDLSLDATCDQAHAISKEFNQLASYLEIPHRGFCVGFTVGEGGEEDARASLARELATGWDARTDLK